MRDKRQAPFKPETQSHDGDGDGTHAKPPADPDFQTSLVELRETAADLEQAKARAERALQRFHRLKERQDDPTNK